MLNLFQHLKSYIMRPYETLNQHMKQVQGRVQGDRDGVQDEKTMGRKI